MAFVVGYLIGVGICIFAYVLAVIAGSAIASVGITALEWACCGRSESGFLSDCYTCCRTMLGVYVLVMSAIAYVAMALVTVAAAFSIVSIEKLATAVAALGDAWLYHACRGVKNAASWTRSKVSQAYLTCVLAVYAAKEWVSSKLSSSQPEVALAQ